MAEWPLVGRGRELAYLRNAAVDPRRRGVVLAAPAGYGKTRLARECVRAAKRAGMGALVATASQSAAEVPLGAMASVLSTLDMVDQSVDDPGAVLHNAVLHLLARSGGGRVLVFVDDAHLLDGASASLVQQLAQHEEVFLLLTLRTQEPVPDALGTLLKAGLLDRLDIGDLDPASIETLLTKVLGGPLDGATLPLLIARSRGNILFLRELVTAGLEDGSLRQEHGLWRLVGESVPSDRLVALVETRLGRLSGDERHLLELLAVGEPLGSRELQSLSRIEVAEGLEDLGLVSSLNDGRRLEIRLAHPVYGEVLRSRLSGLHSRRLARALAESVENAGMRRRNDALRVGTWRLAGGGGQPAELLTAARAARWQFDLELALRLANAAAAAGGGFDARLLSAHLLLLNGRHEQADSMLVDLCRESDAEQQVRATLARIDIAYMRARADKMQLLLDTVAPPTDPDLTAALVGRRVTATFILAGPARALEIPVPTADAGHGDEVIPLRLTRALCLSRQGHSRAAEQELARVDGATHVSPHLGWWRFPHAAVLSEVVANRGHLSESIELSRRQYEHGLAIRSVEMQLFSAWQLATRYVQAGRLDSAARFAHEATALAEQLGYDICLSCLLHLSALIEALAQRPVEARRALVAHERLGDLTNAYSLGLIGEANAWTAVAEGDLHSARERLLATAQECSAIGDRISAASALHSLVRIGRAKDAVEALKALAAEVDGPWPTLYARHAEAITAHDAESLETVCRSFERLGATLLAAEAAGDASSEWQRAGDARRAVAARRLAAGLAERCEGAQTPPLQGLAVRDQLTAAEQETARYAAAGHANKAIAERLGLSVRTVEARIQSVYHKLGLRRREELAAALLAGPDDSP
jgi:DNA-binding CsgD family transcriptional regulator